ncbi:MAG: hypothetical protein MUE50_20570 [Pirellulaceae bacterium]|nr:hypothetical protein [Pirellulaceae bacterium]
MYRFLLRTMGVCCVFLSPWPAARAAEPWPAPAVAAAGLPRFEHVGIVLDYANLKYNPCNDVIYPSVVRADTLSKPLGKYYMYYAPHNAPGGICLAYADKLEGPWKEYEANPVIGRDWQPHYKVGHVSGPHAIWNEEEQKLFVYYHGENDITRFASSADGIRFTYEGVAVTTKMFDKVSEASYARIQRHSLPGKDNRYIMLVMGNNGGTRKIYLAWSKDGRTWETRRTPFLEPQTKTGQLAAAWHLPFRGKHFLIYHDYGPQTDLHACEVDAAFEQPKYLGLFYPHDASDPHNVAQMSECFIEENGKLYMFTNVGPRLSQKIALAIASSNTMIDRRQIEPSQAQPSSSQTSGSSAPDLVNKVALQAEPFDLRDVQLLDSPFKRAQAINLTCATCSFWTVRSNARRRSTGNCWWR